MTVSYTLELSQTSFGNIFRILFRWRGSVWKAVGRELILWCIAYLTIFLILNVVHGIYNSELEDVAKFAVFFNTNFKESKLEFFPLTFLLGFYVNFVVNRWMMILKEIGYIDKAALEIASFIPGDDEDTRVLRRNLVRYMVLTQTNVLRDISLQVRKRFPTNETLIAAELATKEELALLDRIRDPYSRYWGPIQWCNSLICKARANGKISSDYLMLHIMSEIKHFHDGLANLLKFDWVPVPLLYSQVTMLAVRLYFFICLFTKQYIINHHEKETIWILPLTILQFLIYMGWLKTAEGLLNPLGEDDDDLECNHIIDRNLITGLSLVDNCGRDEPEQQKDGFWDKESIIPLYTLETAQRTVQPLLGSASDINLVKHCKRVVVLPHKSVLCTMDEATHLESVKLIDVEAHNAQHLQARTSCSIKDPDSALEEIRRQHPIEKDRRFEQISRIPRTLSTNLAAILRRRQGEQPKNADVRHFVP